MSYDIDYMWNLKYNANELTKQKQTHRQENKLMVTKGGRGLGKDKLGVWDQQIQPTIYKRDKQLGPTVQHRELY